MGFWQAGALLLAGTFASVIGSSLLRYAALESSPSWAVAGVSLWVLSGLTFVHLAKEQDLGTLSILTTALSILMANGLGIWIFGEDLTLRKLAAGALILGAMIVLALPGTRT